MSLLSVARPDLLPPISGTGAWRIAIVSTHPIQYYSAWFRALAAHPAIDLRVYYCHQASGSEQAAAGFGVEFEWDTPLFEGYSYEFLPNVARVPTIHTFGGLDTPAIGPLLRRDRYDAVLLIGWRHKSAWQTMWACRRSGTPLLVRSDSHLHTQRSRRKELAKRMLYPRFIRRFDACLPVGTWSRDYFLHFGARPDRVFLVPHVPDHRALRAAFSACAPQRAELRARWGLSKGGMVFLFAGKLVDLKRPLDLIRAASIARAGGAHLELLIAGDGPMRAACEELAESLQVKASFTGFLNQSEMPAAYCAADVLVLPSDARETWGMVINEAMACLRPCLVSDQVGASPDLIVPGTTGDVFGLGDLDALAHLLVRYAADRPGVHAMGVAAASHEREYSEIRSLTGVLSAIEAVTSARRQHARTN